MRITFAYPRTLADGSTHMPDDTADVPDDEARQLLVDGFARAAGPAPARTASKPTAAGRSEKGD
ncbi:hypothetical protein [Streptomyces sp. CAU 1734]|uniref:hypothetical protein n=1 Tax=Streptomyces sp. CAU 1734 TaxID=3140360 RepID=UPI0032602E10